MGYIKNSISIIIGLIVLILMNSCSVQKTPVDLLGKWEKLEFGRIEVDGSELLSNIENDSCPNDYYLFSKRGRHVLSTYEITDGKCEEYPEERTYKVEGDRIIVNDGKYSYTIKELKPNYLKLYLHKHEFTDTDSPDKNTIFIYTFTKNNKIK